MSFVVRWRNRLQLAALFGCALLGAASTAWPLGEFFSEGAPVWWMQMASIGIFYRVITNRAPFLPRFLSGTFYATVWLACTFGWLYTAMHTYGGLDAWAAVISLLVLAAALGIYYGAATYLHAKYENKSPATQALVFSALWTAAELARGTWLTGFGWGASGYAHTNGPLSIYIPYIGAYGVGALAVWIAATLAISFKVPRWQLGLAAFALVTGVWLTPIDWTQSNGSLTVTLLQGNIAQSEKFEESTGVPAALHWYADAMLHTTSQLTVAPETAIPLLPQELPEGYLATILRRFTDPDVALLTGIPLGNYQTGYTNSVTGLSSSMEYRYDKHHLVPFGEFIPPMFRWFTRMMNIPLGDFNRGTLGQPSFSFANQRLAPNICYEDLFGEEIGVGFFDSEKAPTILVNVSNLGWFGGGLVIDQHLQISRMRALEFERPFVSATNTGTTVIIDHKGHVTAALPRLTQGVLTAPVEGRTGNTPFAWWISRFGLWPYWILIGGILFAGWRSKSKK